MNKLKIYSGMIALSLSLGLTGCGNTAACDLTNHHAHAYVNEEGYTIYRDSEKLTWRNYNRIDDYRTYEKNDIWWDVILKEELFFIDDNVDKLREVENENEDYLEYRYSYIYNMPIPHVTSNGKTTSVYYTYIPTVQYSWTNNPNHSRLTGKTRVCHYQYYGYRLIEDEKGRVEIEKSTLVDSLLDIKEEYPFFKSHYIKIVNVDTLEEVDYEDGQEEVEEETNTLQK